MLEGKTPPKTIYRIGRKPDPWQAPDWSRANQGPCRCGMSQIVLVSSEIASGGGGSERFSAAIVISRRCGFSPGGFYSPGVIRPQALKGPESVRPQTRP